MLLVCTLPAQSQEHVTFLTSDSVTIHGDWYIPAEDSHGVLILLHMNRSNRTLWKSFADQAAAANFSVLAIDFRGHGESTKSAAGDILFESLTNDDYAKMVNDVESSFAWILQKQSDTPIGVLGASIGANVALNFAAKHTSIKAIALLSPGEDYRGVLTIPAMKEYGHRPCLIIAAEDDNYSMVSSKKLAETAGEGTDLHLYTSGGHGTHLFESHADLSEILIQYFQSKLNNEKKNSG